MQSVAMVAFEPRASPLGAPAFPEAPQLQAAVLLRVRFTYERSAFVTLSLMPFEIIQRPRNVADKPRQAVVLFPADTF